MNSTQFYLNEFKYIEGTENADVFFIPALSRRRMSSLDKVTCASLKACINENVENIIFASKTGEVERLLTMVSQYQNDGETSPAIFSGSVHNFAVSFFLMNEQKTIHYTALAAGEETIASGIYAAIVSKYKNNLFVYSDIENDKYVSLCLDISKNKRWDSKKFSITLCENCKTFPSVKDFAKLFSDDLKIIKTPCYTIERVFDD